MNKLVYFENNFYESFENNTEEDAFACLTIDGYPENDNLEGEVVAKVWITKHGDIVVDWHNNGYRLNKQVKNMIEESKKILKEQYEEENHG